MLSAELISTLRQLNHADKLRAVQLLVNDLVEAEPEVETALILAWTHGSFGAASVMEQALAELKAAQAQEANPKGE